MPGQGTQVTSIAMNEVMLIRKQVRGSINHLRVTAVDK